MSDVRPFPFQEQVYGLVKDSVNRGRITCGRDYTKLNLWK